MRSPAAYHRARPRDKPRGSCSVFLRSTRKPRHSPEHTRRDVESEDYRKIVSILAAHSRGRLCYKILATRSAFAARQPVRRHRAHRAKPPRAPARWPRGRACPLPPAPILAARGASPPRGRGAPRAAHRQDRRRDWRSGSRAKIPKAPAYPPPRIEPRRHGFLPAFFSAHPGPWPHAARLSSLRAPADGREARSAHARFPGRQRRREKPKPASRQTGCAGSAAALSCRPESATRRASG